MRRRTVTVVGAALAIVCASAVAGLAQRLARERQRERARYELELTRLRQEAARPVAGERPHEPSPPGRMRTVCVSGVDTFVLAAYRASPSPLVREGRLDLARLKLWSAQAVRAERWVEQAHEPPALPRRLGCAKTERQRDGQERCAAPLDPPRTACGGQAFAEFLLPAPPATRTQATAPASGARPAPAKGPPARRSNHGSRR